MYLKSDYEVLEKLYESSRTLVYRAMRKADEKAVILKIFKSEYPAQEEFAVFKREYEITKRFDDEGIIKVYSLEAYENGYMMVMEDFGGESLVKHLKGKKIETSLFFHLAIRITDILGIIHQSGIIHKDINPSNIIWNPATGQVKLIDFGIASELHTENAEATGVNSLGGTLEYIAPEQTGRMNRSIDYRSDYYSLGVTFYELLSGVLPFLVEDQMELVHCHIARQPILLNQFDPSIPVALAQIIEKLMAKTAEERYQSSFGLKADLEICVDAFITTGTIKDFTIGKVDILERFQIPKRLYGREVEMELLVSALNKVGKGNTEILLVSGYAGIGKSALVSEMHKFIAAKNGYYTSGKFDQYERNMPYSALIQAFRNLIRQILTEGEEQVDNWRKRLLEALGQQGQIIIDVLPELELLIGKQHPVRELTPQEAQNRFNLYFQNFVYSLASNEKPLVLFIDDLQWSDVQSLKLLGLLFSDTEMKNILFIGAYRDNESDSASYLMKMLDEIEKSGRKIKEIRVQNLALEHITELLGDLLKCHTEKARLLAELCMKKTSGNPFFLNQFLVLLYDKGLIKFDRGGGNWQWDITQIEDAGITDNVVAFMIGKIQQLSFKTQEIMKLASCIGSQFDLKTLSSVGKKTDRETTNDLWEAIEAGLILPIDNAYQYVEEISSLKIEFKFLHDRVQQAAYNMIEARRKMEIHLGIGHQLAENLSEEEREERLFDRVNHLNMASELITDEASRLELARLNLKAGKKAMDSAAYGAAYAFFKYGMDMLGDESWDKDYSLTLSLYTKSAEALFMSEDDDKYELMESLIALVLKHARDVLDKIKVYDIKANALNAQCKARESVLTSFEALKLLGIKVPNKQSMPDMFINVLKIKRLLSGKRKDKILALPAMTDVNKIATMHMMSRLHYCVYLVTPEYVAFETYTRLRLSMKYGNDVSSCFAYMDCALVLMHILGDFDGGYELGKTTLKLFEGEPLNEYSYRALACFTLAIRPFKEPLKKVLPVLRELFQSGLENGNNEFGPTTLTIYGINGFLSGQKLSSLLLELVKNNAVYKRTKQAAMLDELRMYMQLIAIMSGEAGRTCILDGKYFDREHFLAKNSINEYVTSFFVLHFNTMVLYYNFEDYIQAITYAEEAKKLEASYLGQISLVHLYFYDSLARLAAYNSVSDDKQKEFLKRIKANKKKLSKWVKHSHANFLHMYYLIEAELQAVLKKDAKAIAYYELSIKTARQNEYINIEALASELAAKFYLSREKEKMAQIHLKDAYFAYRNWGAAAKTKHLEEKYPQFFLKTGAKEVAAAKSTITASITSSENTGIQQLDLRTVIKASQVISSEIVLDKLLEKMLETVLENAGAQKGCLILDKEGELFVEAHGSIGHEKIEVMQSIPLADWTGIPITLVNYVVRTMENVVLNNALDESIFSTDPYIMQEKPISLLCMPVINQRKMVGILYLENNLADGAFTPERFELLKMLSAQIAVSIENARLYGSLAKAKVQLEEYNHTLEQKVEERTEALREKTKELLLKQQQIAVKEERERMARDLHDNLGQILGFINVQTQGISEYLKNGRMEPAVKCLERLTEVAQQAQNTVRETILSMREDVATGKKESVDFFTELNKLASDFTKGYAIQVEIDHAGVEGFALQDLQVKMQILNIIKESLNNVVKHARASTVKMLFEEKQDWLHIDISDNGCGFDVGNRESGSSNHYGLLFMKERAEEIGGSLSLYSQIGKGTTVKMQVPETHGKIVRR